MKLAACIALLACAMQAAAHDSWLVAQDGGIVFATGNRYPVAETKVPAPVTCDRTSCWVQTGEASIDLPADVVEVYLREVRPDAEVVRLWRTTGSWHERYSKFARIEVTSSPQSPVGAGLEIVREGPSLFRVFANSQPLPRQSVELVCADRAEWAESDREGRVHLRPTSHCIVRAIHLGADGAGWRSHFATLALK